MGPLIRRLAVLVTVLAIAGGAAGCGGSDDPGAKKSEKKAAAAEEPAVPKVVKVQRWPRYWATKDTAEEGSSDDFSTSLFAAYDETSVVYNGQDVIRFLDSKTGEQRKQVVLKGNRLVCSSQPRPQIENGIVLVVLGKPQGDACDTVVAFAAATGRELWRTSTTPGLSEYFGNDVALDQRDGVVMLGGSLGDLSALDAKTGKPLWRRTASDYFFERPRKKKDECFLNPALAADRDVIIASLGCDDFAGDRKAGIHGIDLKTGKQLWATDYWVEDEFGGGANERMKPHVSDGRLFLADLSNKEAVTLDSESGKVTPFKEPVLPKLGGRRDHWPVCDAFLAYTNGGAGGSFSDKCAFTNGEQMVFADNLSFKNKLRMRIEGVDAETGKSLWVWDERQVNNPKEYVFRDYQFLGYNYDRTEFWIGRNAKDVIRLDVKTGKRVGQGLAAPPLNLATVTVPGPEIHAGPHGGRHHQPGRLQRGLRHELLRDRRGLTPGVRPDIRRRTSGASRQADAFHHGSVGSSPATSKWPARRGERQPHPVLVGLAHHPLHRVRPLVEGEVERRPVDRQQDATADLAVHADGLLRIEVYVGPAGVVGADRQHRQVERPVALTDPGEGRGVARVATEEHPALLPRHHPARPERGVAAQAAPGEVPRLGAGEGEPAELVRLVPVELDDAVLRDAPPEQVLTDPERHDERPASWVLHQVVDRRRVEVVVVVVRDQHRAQRGQVVQRHRDRVVATWPHAGRR